MKIQSAATAPLVRETYSRGGQTFASPREVIDGWQPVAREDCQQDANRVSRSWSYARNASVAEAAGAGLAKAGKWATCLAPLGLVSDWMMNSGQHWGVGAALGISAVAGVASYAARRHQEGKCIDSESGWIYQPSGGTGEVRWTKDGDYQKSLHFCNRDGLEPPAAPEPKLSKRIQGALGGLLGGSTSGAFMGLMCGMAIGAPLGGALALLAIPGHNEAMMTAGLVSCFGGMATGAWWGLVDGTIEGTRLGWESGKTPNMWGDL